MDPQNLAVASCWNEEWSTWPTEIADAVCASVEAGIARGVATLPMMGNVVVGDETNTKAPHPKQNSDDINRNSNTNNNTDNARILITDALLYHYRQAADLVELYGRRNVVSLAMIQPLHRREAIRAAYFSAVAKETNRTGAENEVEKEEETLEQPDTAAPPSTALDSSSAVTTDQMESMELEWQSPPTLSDLQHTVVQLRQRRDDLRRQALDWEAAAQLVDLATAASHSGETLTSSMAAVVAVETAVQTCQALHAQASALQHTMHDQKRLRRETQHHPEDSTTVAALLPMVRHPADDENRGSSNSSNYKQRNKNTTTLSERYDHARQNVTASGVHSVLSSIHNNINTTNTSVGDATPTAIF